MSYTKITCKGRLLPQPELLRTFDTAEAWYKTLEEMYGMIWFLAGMQLGQQNQMTIQELVEEARQHSQDGLIIAKEVND